MPKWVPDEKFATYHDDDKFTKEFEKAWRSIAFDKERRELEVLWATAHPRSFKDYMQDPIVDKEPPDVYKKDVNIDTYAVEDAVDGRRTSTAKELLEES